MGVDHNAYIGPYVRVTETVARKQIDRCAAHNFPEDAAYCPKCGTPKANRFAWTESSDAPDSWEEDYKKGGRNSTFHDFLHSTSVMSGPDVEEHDGKRTRTYIYLPNRYYDELKLPRIDGGKYSEEEVPFDDLDVKGTLKKFNELYADELAYLKQWFEVEVKFGYVSYCS